MVLRALILIILLLGGSIQLFTEESVEAPPSPLPRKLYYGEDPTPSFLSEHNYFKVGSSIPLVQTIGVGKRWNHFDTLRGNDFCMNIKAAPLVLLPTILLSAEYTRLFYKPFNPDKDYYKYAGFGLEVGWVFLFPAFFPNPKIVWGKEQQNGRFSQWSCNLIPTAIFLLVVGDLLLHPKHRCGLEYGIAITAGGCMFEYSVGF